MGRRARRWNSVEHRLQKTASPPVGQAFAVGLFSERTRTLTRVGIFKQSR